MPNESFPHPGVSPIPTRNYSYCEYRLAGYIKTIITMFIQVGVDRNLQGILLLMAIVNHRVCTILAQAFPLEVLGHTLA